MSRDRVKAEDAEFVIRRDNGCCAPLIDPAEGWRCWGRSTIDHVKAEPRMGVRAESVLTRMVAVCEGHSEAGIRAGYQWNTAHRTDQRAYLARVNTLEAS
jgi:hypothetical protein